MYVKNEEFGRRMVNKKKV